MDLVEKYKKQYSKITQFIMKELLKEKERENIVLSPYSVILLLAITAHAADKNTRKEILKAIAPKMKMEQFEEFIIELQKYMNDNYELFSSNAVCVRNDYEKTIQCDYPDELSTIFDGRLFSSNSMISDVNAWVKEHTNGMIDEIVDKSFEDMLSCIINAIAFEAEWEDKYEEGTGFKDDFRNADGSVSEASYLSSIESYFVEDDYFKGFVKPYENDEFSFMALLPKEENCETYLLDAIEQVNFSKLFKESSFKTIFVKMPEFKYDFSHNLKALFKKLGIEEVFMDAADFSNMSSANLKVDGIFHKAHIEVDRKGTKAAAVTARTNVIGCCMIYLEEENITLDRPFVYAIMNKRTGLPVLVGVTNQL